MKTHELKSEKIYLGAGIILVIVCYIVLYFVQPGDVGIFLTVIGLFFGVILIILGANPSSYKRGGP